MIKNTDIEFCEDCAINIEKFVGENFNLESYGIKKNKRNNKWKIKHEEIAAWPNIITVPIPFACRYKELVAMGKLIIVKDGYSKYKVYINPQVIIKTWTLSLLISKLEELKQEDESTPEIKILEKEIASIQEDIRIINHFHGEESLKYTNKMSDLIQGQRRILTKRQAVLKKGR